MFLCERRHVILTTTMSRNALEASIMDGELCTWSVRWVEGCETDGILKGVLDLREEDTSFQKG